MRRKEKALMEMKKAQIKYEELIQSSDLIVLLLDEAEKIINTIKS